MAEGSAESYIPSVKEGVRAGIGAAAVFFIVKKFAPGIALSVGISDGIWVQIKNADGTTAMQWQPTAPK
jgi:hypothetical protein